IVIHGSTGDWAGAEMRGGRLVIAGDAGHLLGAAYRGSPKGMRGGTILVRGNAGNEVGCAMRRGLIAVGGDAGDFTGVMALAGTTLVSGSLGIRAGAGMKRARMGAYQGGEEPPALLPTFKYDCVYRPAWIAVYLRELQAQGFAPSDGMSRGQYRRYSGDFTEI